jgi:hypothetical protein
MIFSLGINFQEEFQSWKIIAKNSKVCNLLNLGLDKEKVLFDVTKTQLENTSFRKTTGKFHYRKNYNDPVLEGERGQTGIQRLDGNGEGLDGRTGDDLD